MTIHSSLKGVNTLVGERSVLSRVERIQKLVKAGKLDTAEGSAYGLPKVRTKFKIVKIKKATAEGAEATDAKAEKDADS
jgi:small basic protein (TIGR04137 family)